MKPPCVVLATLLVLAPCATTAQATLPLKHAPQPTVPAITAQDLMTRLYILADDSMQGRRGGEPGNMKGTAYIEREVRRLGLKPAGDSGGYFQTLPLVRRALSPRSALGAEGQALELGTDFVPIPTRGPTRPVDGVPVVFGGTYDSVAITVEQAAGKFVVITVPNIMSLMRAGPPRPRSALGAAAGVGVVLAQPLPPELLGDVRAPAVVLPPTGLTPPPSPLGLIISNRAAEVLLGTPVAGAQPGAAGKTVHGQILYDETPAPARNVVAILEGSDPKLRGEYVALGAHNDHVGMGRPVDHDSVRAWNAVMRPMGAESPPTGAPTPEQQARIQAVLDSLRKVNPDRPDSIFNGADDDGSGSVGMLEIAERFATARPAPRRSILFVWHTGEELGLLGSRWFTDHPTVPRDSIVTEINMDMIGRGDAADVPGGGPAFLQLVGSRKLSTELGDIVDAVNKAEPQPFTFDYQYDVPNEPHNIYCRSDHALYARFGIPIAFFFTGVHRDYHQVTDEPEYIDYPKMARVTQLVYDITARVADLDHRPVVDKPKPDPNAPCRS